MPTDVKAPGLPRLRRDLAEFAREAEHPKEAEAEAARMLAAAAASRAPRRTGRLAASVRGTVNVGGAMVEATAPYAGVIHSGWPARHIAPHPFITDAYAAKADAVAELYREDLQRTAAHAVHRTY